jgi:TRAP transporter TAXI family solute receptor
MQQRLTALLVVAGLVGLILSGLLAAGAASPPVGRISFQIATGSSAGAFFPVGQAIAGLISHPPGVDRCDAAPVCGPAGLVISVRTSQGAIDNVTEVNDGDAESGFAQSDVVAAAVKGRAPFHGKAAHIRVLASLFDEDVHLVVAAHAKIKSVADLRGKRVSLGDEGAGSSLTMREILYAYNLPDNSVKLVPPGDETDTALIQEGKLDAFFAVGGVPQPVLAALFAQGKIRLVPIDGAGRDRLIKMVPSFKTAVIPANLYAGQGATQTVATRALWIVRDSVPDDLVYGIARALFQPMNRAALGASHPSAREINLADAAVNLPAPLHAGAARFYDGAAAKH